MNKKFSSDERFGLGHSANGRDEMNLAEFPFAALNPKDNRDVITYEGWITNKDGEKERQRWVARGAGGLGLPSEFGERLLMALISITAEQGFNGRKVPFSIYQLLNMLGLSRNKRYYELVEKQLEKLVGMTIYSEGAFWSAENQKRITTKNAFHLIDHLWLRYQESDERVREEENVPAYIVWSEQLWSSFHYGYIKSLDLKFYYTLKTPLARRMFRFLDKRMRYQTVYEIDIFELANRLGMADYEMPSRVKRKLKPAFDILIEEGFLKQVKTLKVKKYTRVRFTKAQKPHLEQSYQKEISASSEQVSIFDEDIELAPSQIIEGETVPLVSLTLEDRWKEQWLEVLEVLQLQTPKSAYEAWLKDTQVVRYESGQLYIKVKNEQAQEWLEHRLKPLIVRAVAKVMPENKVKLTFEV